MLILLNRFTSPWDKNEWKMKVRGIFNKNNFIRTHCVLCCWLLLKALLRSLSIPRGTKENLSKEVLTWLKLPNFHVMLWLEKEIKNRHVVDITAQTNKYFTIWCVYPDHIEFWTKWLSLCRIYFQIHFHERNISCFHWNCTQVFPGGPINNLSLVQVMAWRRTGDTPLPEPMMIHCTDACIHHPWLLSVLINPWRAGTELSRFN